MLKTKNIYLRPMEIEDVKLKVQWLNDEKVGELLGFAEYPASEVSTLAWLRKVSESSDRKDFIICLHENNLPIGFCGIKNIDYKNSKAESYLGIGNTEYWGKGLGIEVKNTLLDYSFNFMGLNKVYSYHNPTNESMIKINIKLGGHKEGLLKENVNERGIMVDTLVMAVLRKNYINTK